MEPETQNFFSRFLTRNFLIPFFLYAAIALLIMAPIFSAPGYVFLLDMVWGPGMTIEDSLRNGLGPGLPIFAIHRALATFIPNDLLQKILLFFVLFLPGISMFSLARRFFSLSLAFGAGLFFLLNPFVHERFLAGQWIVLLGYGFLPKVVGAFLDVIETPHWKRFFSFALLFAIFPLISLHFAYISLPILFVLGILFFAQKKNWHALFSRALFFRIALFLGIFLTLNSFWLFGFFDPSKSFAHFGESDFQTFATTAGETENVFVAAISLYGFWDNDFFTTRDLFPFWYSVSGIILFLSFLGALGGIFQKNRLAITFSLLFVPIFLLAIGFGNSFTRFFTEWCLAYLPFFRGLRDSAKLLGVLAFFYALLLPAGALIASSSLKKYFFPHARSFIVQNSHRNAVILTSIIPFLFAGGLLWGSWGQIVPLPYPNDWYAVQSIFSKDPKATRAIFLPWKGYFELDFARNTYVANPANAFFTLPVITSKDTGNQLLLASAKSEWDSTVTALLEGGTPQENALASLREKNISHIILAKIEKTTNLSQILNRSSHLHLLFDSKTIALYKIETLSH